MDETRLDAWRAAWEDSRRRLEQTLRQGAALYPAVGAGPWPTRRPGTIYGSRRPPLADVDDEGVRTQTMDGEQGRWVPAEEPVTYAEARERAVHHAVQASRWAGSTQGSGKDTAIVQAVTSRAWSGLAALLRVEESRAATEAYAADLRRELEAQGLTSTGRRVRLAQEFPPGEIPFPPGPDLYVREPVPPLSTSLDDPASPQDVA